MMLLAGMLHMVGGVLVPFITVALLVSLLAGRLRPTRPRCRGCRAPLGYLDLVEFRKCSACHESTEQHPPTAMVSRHWLRSLALIVGLIALAIGLVSAGNAVQRRSRIGYQIPTQQTPAQLVAGSVRSIHRIANQTMELERRLATGELPREEFRALLTQEIQSLGTAGLPQANQPGLRATVGFALETGSYDDPLAVSLLHLGFQAPALATGSLLDPPHTFQIQSGPSGPDSDGLGRIEIVREVRIDGKSVPFTSGDEWRDATDEDCLLRSQAMFHTILLREPPPPEARSIEVDIESWLLPGTVLAVVHALPSGDASAPTLPALSEFPRPIAKMTRTLSSTLREEPAATPPG